MPFPITHEQEQLNIVYVRALAARAGVGCISHVIQDYGVDMLLQPVEQSTDGFDYTGSPLQCQLKATWNWEHHNNTIIYEMKARAYNKLLKLDKAILILLCLPKNWSEWISISADELVLRKCCYWYRVTDVPTDNSASKTIYIPATNQLTEEVLVELVSRKPWEFER